MQQPQRILSEFHRLFGGQPAVFRAPGRVNIIGEHTDYSEGFVLPAAASFYCWAAVAPRNDDTIAIHSSNTGETVYEKLSSLEPRKKWSDYSFGVAAAFEKAGFALQGANIFLDGEVPLGAGLSSSAAIEVATALALAYAAKISVGPEGIALLGQQAENEFVGTKCGIMDQFASCLGKSGYALCLDCRSLHHKLVPVPEGIALVVCNTMRKHELNAGEYNQRRRECEIGVERLRAALPDIRTLRDVSREDLERHRQLLPMIIYRRCRHVVTENDRVHQMVHALQADDTVEMSRLMAESHGSLRDDFQVSTAELDQMVHLAQQQKGFVGGRMMGGGFGGCTINLVQRGDVATFSSNISSGYQASVGLTPEIYHCEPAEGAGEVLTQAAQGSHGSS